MTKPMHVLGFGGFGQVIAAVLHGRTVAVKTAKSDKVDSGLSALVNELRVFRHVRHPNLVQFYGAVLDVVQSQVALVFELVHGITLDRLMTSSSASPIASTRYCILMDVCCALWYLHRQQPPIVHGDIKPNNIMVEQVEAKPRAKIIDFGLSTVMARSESRRGGTRSWCAPEALQSIVYKPRTSADVFSFGWLLHFVLTGMEPYGGTHGEEQLLAIKQAMSRGGIDLPDVPEGTSPFQPEARKLCQACLGFVACMRPTMQSVYAELAGWIGKFKVDDLGVDAAMALLPRIDWDFKPWISMSGGSWEGIPFPIQVDLCRDLTIKYIGKGASSIFGENYVGKSFLSFLFEPGHFQVIVAAARNDLLRKGAFASQMMHFSGLALKEGPTAAKFDASITLFFPDASGAVSMRIVGLHSRTCNLPVTGGSSSAAHTLDGQSNHVVSL